MPDPVNIAEVVASFYSELKIVATDLNAVSDELGKTIAEIDKVLTNLNLGIAVWMQIRKGSGNFDRGDESYWSEEIGYAKSQGRWGICLRKTEGDASMDVESCEMWLFNDAPRALRLIAIDHIVGLLRKLTEAGQATTREIQEKLADARQVATAMSKAARPPLPRRSVTFSTKSGEAK